MRLNTPASFGQVSPATPGAGENGIYANVSNVPRLTLGGVNAVALPGRFRRPAAPIVVNPGNYLLITGVDLIMPPGRWAYNFTFNYTATFSGSSGAYVGWGVYVDNAANRSWITALSTWSEGASVATRWDSLASGYTEALVSTTGQTNFVRYEGIVEFTSQNTIRLACNTGVASLPLPTVTIQTSSFAHIMPITA